MVRPPCCDKLNVRRGHWTEEDDAKIPAYVSKHGTRNWNAAPKKAGLRRCGKSSRLRWTNYPRPDLRHEYFTSQEEELIIRLHSAIGSRWSIIAQQLPGRTDNDVKNYWNTKLRKKLSEMGIDPVTHKPFSQILADYGNINGGLPKSAATRIGSLNPDSRSAFALKPEQEGYPNLAMEYPVQGSFLNKHNSLDLLAQLQAITLVATAAETKTPHGDHCSSASSSSSSSSASSSSLSSSPNFSWQDFLLEDPFLPSDAQEENVGQNEIVLPQSGPKQEGQITENFSEVVGMSCDSSIKGFEPPPSNSDSSFVEAMLDGQDDMLSEFPAGLLEEPFLY